MSIFFGISPDWLSTYSNILVYKSFIFSIWRILFLFSVSGGSYFKKALNAVNPAKVEESAFQVFSNYFSGTPSVAPCYFLFSANELEKGSERLKDNYRICSEGRDEETRPCLKVDKSVTCIFCKDFEPQKVFVTNRDITSNVLPQW